MTLQSIGYDLYQRVFRLFMALVEREYVPDFIIRRGIQFLLSQRLQEVQALPCLPTTLATNALYQHVSGVQGMI